MLLRLQFSIPDQHLTFLTSILLSRPKKSCIRTPVHYYLTVLHIYYGFFQGLANPPRSFSQIIFTDRLPVSFTDRWKNRLLGSKRQTLSYDCRIISISEGNIAQGSPDFRPTLSGLYDLIRRNIHIDHEGINNTRLRGKHTINVHRGNPIIQEDRWATTGCRIPSAKKVCSKSSCEGSVTEEVRHCSSNIRQ